MATINPLVEGDIDAAIAARLISHTGHNVGIVYGRRGVGYVEAKLAGFNRSAKGSRYLAMVDLMDTANACAPDVVRTWLPHPEPMMLFRVVVREIESWLLADVEGMSEFLGVAPVRFVAQPESIQDPKQMLVNITRHSRSKGTRNSIVPDNRSTATVGPRYNAEMIRFVLEVYKFSNSPTDGPSGCMAV
ncbi:MAG: hypothetical protein AB7O31_11840 [Burkholderiales bacterium]